MFNRQYIFIPGPCSSQLQYVSLPEGTLCQDAVSFHRSLSKTFSPVTKGQQQASKAESGSFCGDFFGIFQPQGGPLSVINGVITSIHGRK